VSVPRRTLSHIGEATEDPMCWMCDDPTMTKDDALARMAGLVADHGWALQYVEGGRVRPPWCYTVGLSLYGVPELLVTGLRSEDSARLLNGMAAHLVDHDGTLSVGERFVPADGREYEVVGMPHPDAHLLTTYALMGDLPIRALQLVWSDDRGHWPWDVGFRSRRGGQPVLGPRAGTPSPRPGT